MRAVFFAALLAPSAALISWARPLPPHSLVTRLPAPAQRVLRPRSPPPQLVHPLKRGPATRVPFSTKSYLQQTTGPKTLAQSWIGAGVPKWVTLLDEVLFVLASAMFVRGSLDFFPDASAQSYLEGCELFMAGSAAYLWLAVFAAYEVVEDARLSGKPVSNAAIIEQGLYVIGSYLFLLGTALFTPDLSTGLDSAAAAAAAGGADPPAGELIINFLGQNYYFSSGKLPAPPDTSVMRGDELFVLGSVIFSIAAFVSALAAMDEDLEDNEEAVIRRRTSVACASLYELGGVCFVVGNLGFVPASTLGITACPTGTHNLMTGGATCFVAGSCLYLLGSLLILTYQTWSTYRIDDGASADGSGGDAVEEAGATRARAFGTVVSVTGATPAEQQMAAVGSDDTAAVAQDAEVEQGDVER